MPPKAKITKDDILKTAVELVRAKGEGSLNARTIAGALGCSTQPIFSNFAGMDELRFAVIGYANDLSNEYIKKEVESGLYPTYKATGMAYIRFAKQEKQLFKLLYMRDRTLESLPDTLEFDSHIETIVRDNTGLSLQNARLFHLEIWAYVHGIATMFATEFLDLEWELVSKMLTDVYCGLRRQYEWEK